MLVDYRPAHRGDMHVEHGVFRDDCIEFAMADGFCTKLPLCEETVDRYIARAGLPRVPLWRYLSIFDYVRQ